MILLEARVFLILKQPFLLIRRREKAKFNVNFRLRGDSGIKRKTSPQDIFYVCRNFKQPRLEIFNADKKKVLFQFIAYCYTSIMSCRKIFLCCFSDGYRLHKIKTRDFFTNLVSIKQNLIHSMSRFILHFFFILKDECYIERRTFKSRWNKQDDIVLSQLGTIKRLFGESQLVLSIVVEKYIFDVVLSVVRKGESILPSKKLSKPLSNPFFLILIPINFISIFENNMC